MPSFLRFIKSNWLMVVAALLFGFLAVLTWNSQSLNPLTSPSTKPAPPTFDRLHMKDLQYTAVIAGQDVLLKVQEITHAKRKIGPLTVNPLKELILTGVNLQLTSNISDPLPSSPSPQPLPRNTSKIHASTQPPMNMASLMNGLPTMFKDMFRVKDLGFISRVQIHGLTIQTSNLNEGTFSLIANKVELEISQGAILFSKGVSLETPSHQKLVANEAEWWPKAKTFLIPGTFVLQTQNKESAGRHGAFSFTSSGTLQGPLP